MKEDYIARGFQKIHDDLTFLMICFREVLEELGEHYLANNLPWINQVNVDAEPNPRLCQAYSIAFQLLNMVEENVAAQVRRARESEIGLSGEIRPVNRIDQRIAEAEKMGFEQIFISRYNKKEIPTSTKIKVQMVGKMEEFFGKLFA